MHIVELARRLSGTLEGGVDVAVTGAAPIDRAGPEHATFLVKLSAAAQLATTRAGVVLVPPAMVNPTGRCVVRVEDPRLAFARLVGWLQPRESLPRGVHPTAIVHPTAQLGRDVAIGPYSLVGAHAELGDGVELQARVTVYDRVRIGHRTVVHAGAVLGADGFGFAPAGDRYEKVPQVGGLEIGDDVEIGANTTIDRGTLVATRIGDGTKLDNLVHIAHNCVVGRHVVIAAQTGLAGGAVVDDWAVLGGQVGVGDKVHIEARARVGSASAIPTGKRIPADEVVWGVPARPLRKYLRMMANLGQVERLRERMRGLFGARSLGRREKQDA